MIYIPTDDYKLGYAHGYAAAKENIVLCKDCKHRNGETNGCNRNPSVEPWKEKDYCSYGERKNEEDL